MNYDIECSIDNRVLYDILNGKRFDTSKESYKMINGKRKGM